MVISNTQMTKAEQVARDLRILRHIGQYRVSIAPVITRIHLQHNYGAYKQVISRLKRNQWVVARRGTWPGPLVYYQLTPTGAAYAKVPRAWSDQLGPDALRESLQVLWWCSMTSGMRSRVDANKVAELLGTRPPRAIHCALRRPNGGGTLYRMYLPGPETDAEGIFKRLTRLAGAIARSGDLKEHSKSKDYGLQALVTSKQVHKIVYARLRKASSEDEWPWNESVFAHVGITVGIEDIPDRSAKASKENERLFNEQKRTNNDGH